MNISIPNKNKGPVGTILVTDDAQVMRYACQRALEKAGHRVLLASGGEEAINIAKTEDIDIALLDIKMPGISGLEVLRAIKSGKPLVEVIMMTAYATQDVAEESTHLGASGFLTKPFTNIRILTDTVREALTRKRLRENGVKGEIQIEDLLVNEGMVKEERLKEAKEKALELNISVKEALVRMGDVQMEDIDWVLAKALDIPFVRLNEKNIDPEAARRIPAYLARRYRMIPLLVEERSVHVAVDDPFNMEGLEIIKSRYGLEPIINKGFGPEIDAMIRLFYPEDQAEIEKKINALNANADPKILLEIMEKAHALELNEAHFEPIADRGDSEAKNRKSWTFRITGVLVHEREEKE